MSATNFDTVQPLGLSVLSAPEVVQPGEETPIEIALTNCSSSILPVNHRMGMGYADTAERDLYCEILTENGERYLGYQAFAMDYHRKPLSEAFISELGPGESLLKMFDLQAWYRLTEPGVYDVRVIYDPEPYAPHPDAVRGPIISPAITIQVRA